MKMFELHKLSLLNFCVEFFIEPVVLYDSVQHKNNLPNQIYLNNSKQLIFITIHFCFTNKYF